MKHDWLITFRSVTTAQKAERVLKKAEVPCALRRTPKMLSERGCGYCLQLRETAGPGALAALRRNQVTFGKLYVLDEEGTPRERSL